MNRSEIKAGRIGSKLHLTGVLALLLLLGIVGCWYPVISRFYDSEEPVPVIQEWNVSPNVVAFMRERKKDFKKRFGHSPESYFVYDLYINLWIDNNVDRTLSAEEKHDIRIDSVNVTFMNYSKTVVVRNSFEENARKNGKYLHHAKEITVDSLHISPDISEIRIIVYGVMKSEKDGLDSFVINLSMKLKEESFEVPTFMK